MKNKEDYSKENDNGKENEGKFNLVKEILEMVVYFVGIIIIFLLFQHFVGQHIEVKGSSMENTLSNKDHLILEKITYRFKEPKRFEIVVFRPYDKEEETYYIKRVIGLPGEKIQIKNGEIFINDEVLEDSYGSDLIANPGIASSEILLNEGEYFLIGDNRNNSTDSRSSKIGPVKRKAIVGRAWARIWPMKEIEILAH